MVKHEAVDSTAATTAAAENASAAASSAAAPPAAAALAGVAVAAVAPGSTAAGEGPGAAATATAAAGAGAGAAGSAAGAASTSAAVQSGGATLASAAASVGGVAGAAGASTAGAGLPAAATPAGAGGAAGASGAQAASSAGGAGGPVLPRPIGPGINVTMQPEGSGPPVFRQLKVEDALAYLDKVKAMFEHKKETYSKFLDIMRMFKEQQINTPGVITEVCNLFNGYDQLLLDFNTFLPIGYKIDLSQDRLALLEQQKQREAAAAGAAAPGGAAAAPPAQATMQMQQPQMGGQMSLGSRQQVELQMQLQMQQQQQQQQQMNGGAWNPDQQQQQQQQMNFLLQQQYAQQAAGGQGMMLMPEDEQAMAAWQEQQMLFASQSGMMPGFNPEQMMMPGFEGGAAGFHPGMNPNAMMGGMLGAQQGAYGEMGGMAHMMGGGPPDMRMAMMGGGVEADFARGAGIIDLGERYDGFNGGHPLHGVVGLGPASISTPVNPMFDNAVDFLTAIKTRFADEGIINSNGLATAAATGDAAAAAPVAVAAAAAAAASAAPATAPTAAATAAAAAASASTSTSAAAAAPAADAAAATTAGAPAAAIADAPAAAATAAVGAEVPVPATAAGGVQVKAEGAAAVKDAAKAAASAATDAAAGAPAEGAAAGADPAAAAEASAKGTYTQFLDILHQFEIGQNIHLRNVETAAKALQRRTDVVEASASAAASASVSSASSSSSSSSSAAAVTVVEVVKDEEEQGFSVKEVLDKVAYLFRDHPDLIKRFTHFLPDAINPDSAVSGNAKGKFTTTGQPRPHDANHLLSKKAAAIRTDQFGHLILADEEIKARVRMAYNRRLAGPGSKNKRETKRQEEAERKRDTKRRKITVARERAALRAAEARRGYADDDGGSDGLHPGFQADKLSRGLLARVKAHLARSTGLFMLARVAGDNSGSAADGDATVSGIREVKSGPHAGLTELRMPRDVGYEKCGFDAPSRLSPTKRWNEFLKILMLYSKYRVIDEAEMMSLVRSLMGPVATVYSGATFGVGAAAAAAAASGAAGDAGSGSSGGGASKEMQVDEDDEDVHPLTTGEVAAHKLTQSQRADRAYMQRRRHDEAVASLETSHRRRESLIEGMGDLIHSKGRTPESHMENIWYSMPVAELDLNDCTQCTPSYRELPADYPIGPCSGRSIWESAVLNEDWVSVPLGSENSGSFKTLRRNPYEDALFRIEDERFEVDMAIDANESAIRALLPLVKAVEKLRGVARFSWRPPYDSLSVVNLKAIARIYGARAQEILRSMVKYPAATLPRILKRLQEKNLKWSARRAVLSTTQWQPTVKLNWSKSLDHRSFYFRKKDKGALSNRAIMQDTKDRIGACFTSTFSSVSAAAGHGILATKKTISSDDSPPVRTVTEAEDVFTMHQVVFATLKYTAANSSQMSQTEQNRLSTQRPSMFLRLMQLSPAVTALKLNDDGTLSDDVADAALAAAKMESEDATSDADPTPSPWTVVPEGSTAPAKHYRPLRTVAVLSNSKVGSSSSRSTSTSTSTSAASQDGDGSENNEAAKEDVPEWVSRAQGDRKNAKSVHLWTRETLPFIGGEHACVSLRLYQLLFARVVRARTLCAKEAKRRYELKSSEAAGAPYGGSASSATPTANRYTSDDVRHSMSQPSPSPAAGSKRKRGKGAAASAVAAAAAASAAGKLSKEAERAREAFTSFLVTLVDLIQGNSNQDEYEERCRELMGTGAYIVFTIDRLIQSTLKQINQLESHATSRALFDAWEYELRRSAPHCENSALRYAANAAALLVRGEGERDGFVLSFRHHAASASSAAADQPSAVWMNNVAVPALSDESLLTKRGMGYCDFEVQHIDLEYYTPNELDVGVEAAPTSKDMPHLVATGPAPGGVVRKYCPSVHFRSAWLHDSDPETQRMWLRNGTDPTMQVRVLYSSFLFLF